MSSNETKKAAFEKQMKKGKIYEAKVQSEIKEASPGEVYINVAVGNICEFDAIVADYPILSFIEIKSYRSNIVPRRARSAVNKFREDCLKMVEDPTAYHRYRSWIPLPCSRDITQAYLTNLQLLFEKLSITITEGWNFRMILIVPNKSFEVVLSTLRGKPNPDGKSSHNLLNGDGPVLIVIPEKRIKEVFG